MASMELKLGGVCLAVIVDGPVLVERTADDKPLLLALFVNDNAVANIYGVSEVFETEGVKSYRLRHITHDLVEGEYTNFKLCEFGLADLVAADTKTWNGAKALIAVADSIKGLGRLSAEQLPLLLGRGQQLNRSHGYDSKANKRVRKVTRTRR